MSLGARRLLAALAAVASMAGVANALYIPGAAAIDFSYGQRVELTVNKISSSKTLMPYRYYSLPVCEPSEAREIGVSLGELLSGDRIESSAYELSFGKADACHIVCKRSMSEADASLLSQRIEEEYTLNWIVDNLPAAVRLVNPEDPEDVRYQRGFPLGSYQVNDDGSTSHFIYNHVRFTLRTHAEGDAGTARIVGFEVEPFSVRHTSQGVLGQDGQLETCNPSTPVTRDAPPQSVDRPGDIIFTYDVEWKKSDTPWSHRWDLYLRGPEDADIHWFAILNSAIIVLFLTGIIGMILGRTLSQDLARINNEADEDETAWKLVHGDVFRPPSGVFGPMLLSVLVGSGVQVLAMTVALMVFAVLGVLSPSNRGGLATAFVCFFVVMGAFAGFVSSRLYKMFLGKLWVRNAVLTAVAFPSAVSVVAFSLNMVLWSRGSTLALPFGTMVGILALWFFVSTPLVFGGAYVGFTRDAIKPVTRVSTFARSVPTQPWYLHPVVTCLVGGVLPFGAIFIELYFIMTSIWLAQPYYLFGFLALVVVILALTCAEISIVMCYFQLCAEDHRWWWRSFLTSGCSALYLFLYSILYYATKLDISDPASATLFFGNMLMISFTFFLLTGAIGFLSTLSFVRAIYGQIKVD